MFCVFRKRSCLRLPSRPSAESISRTAGYASKINCLPSTSCFDKGTSSRHITCQTTPSTSFDRTRNNLSISTSSSQKHSFRHFSPSSLNQRNLSATSRPNVSTTPPPYTRHSHTSPNPRHFSTNPSPNPSSTSPPDHYTTLGLPREASLKEIRARYIALSKELHPDRNPSEEAQERFTSVAEAYRTLKDLKNRVEYDERLDRGGKGPYESIQVDIGDFAGKPGRNRVGWYKQKYDDEFVAAKEYMRREEEIGKRMISERHRDLRSGCVKLAVFGLFLAGYWFSGNLALLGVGIGFLVFSRNL